MNNKIVSKVRNVAQRSDSVLAWATYTGRLNRERMVIKRQVKYAKLVIVECSFLRW